MQRRFLAAENEIRHPVAHRQAQGVNAPFDPGRILDLHLDVRTDLLPDPRRGEQDVGADFPEVFLDRFDALGKVDGEPHHEGPVNSELLLADPGEGQKGHVFETLAGGVNLILDFGHPHHVLLGDHAALGQAGGPGGIVDHADVIGGDLRDHFRKQARLLLRELAAEFLNLPEVSEDRVVVMAHALGIVDDHLADVAQRGLKVQHLVGLLLVAGHHVDRIGVIDDVLHLLQMAVGIDAHHCAPQALHRDLGIQPLRPVVAGIGELVSRLKP